MMDNELTFWQRWRPYWIRIVIGCAIGLAGALVSFATHNWKIENYLVTGGMVLMAISVFSFINGRSGGGRTMGGTSSSNYTRQNMERQSSWFWSVFLVAFPLVLVAIGASQLFSGS